MRHKFKVPESIDTYCTVKGVDCDVKVEFDYQPEEPDVNVGQSVDILGVYYEDEGCVLDDMTEVEVRALEALVLGEVVTRGAEHYEDERY